MKKQSSDLVKEAEFFFPEEIMSEILSWLEVKYLLRYKSVCKLWYAIISSERFAGMHAMHDGCRSFHYITPESINSDRMEITSFQCTSMGLCLVERESLAASDNNNMPKRIINPSTKRVLDLPDDPYKRLHSRMQLFRYSSTNSYYVFSMCIDEKNERKFGLLDLGGQSNDPCPNTNLSRKTFSISECDKLVQARGQQLGLLVENKAGILYILVLPKVGLSNLKIICFDLVKQQTCTTLNVPDQSLDFKSTKVTFSNWRGNPAVIFVLDEKVNIWVLEDHEKQKWADMIQIPLPEHSSWNEQESYIYCSNADGEIRLQYMWELPWWIYVPKLQQWCKIPSLPGRVPATLVSIKGMQPGMQLSMQPEKKRRTTKRRGWNFGIGGLFSWFCSLNKDYN